MVWFMFLILPWFPTKNTIYGQSFKRKILEIFRLIGIMKKTRLLDGNTPQLLRFFKQNVTIRGKYFRL